MKVEIIPTKDKDLGFIKIIAERFEEFEELEILEEDGRRIGVVPVMALRKDNKLCELTFVVFRKQTD